MLIDKGNGTIGAAAKMSTKLPVWRIKAPTLRLLDILLVHVQDKSSHSFLGNEHIVTHIGRLRYIHQISVRLCHLRIHTKKKSILDLDLHLLRSACPDPTTPCCLLGLLRSASHGSDSG